MRESEQASDGRFASNIRTIWAVRHYAAPFLPVAFGLIVLAFFQADFASTGARTASLVLNTFQEQPTSGAVASVNQDTGVSPAGWLLKMTGPPEGVGALAGMVALFLSAALGVRIWAEQVRGVVNERFRTRVQGDLLSAMTREASDVRTERDSANSSQIFLQDSGALSGVLVFGVVAAIESLLMIVVFGSRLSQLENGPLITFALFPLLVLFQAVVAKVFYMRLVRTVTTSERYGAQMRARAVEFFDVLAPLVYLKGEQAYAQRVIALSTANAVAGRRQQFVSSLSGGISELVTTLALPLVIIVLTTGWLGSRFGLSAGSIIEAQMLLGFLTASSASLVGFPSMLADNAPAMRRVTTALKVPEVGDPPAELSTLRSRQLPPSLKVENLFFSYSSASGPTLRGLSFEIEPGARVGLVAGSGGGKSTLARLLLGDHKPDSGRVLFDGVDITGWHLLWKRELIGFLPAEPGFIRGTLEENVLFGRSMDNVRNYTEALAASGVDGVAAAKEGGMQFDVSRRVESLLSTGERRRIGIARLLIGDQRLWIFDEPGAGLDQQEMRRVAKDLVRATSGKTSIIITHDPDVFLTDWIIFLAEGAIAGVGPHSELYERNLEYRQLVERNAEERKQQEAMANEIERLKSRLEMISGGIPDGAKPGGPPPPKATQSKVRVKVE